MYGDANYQGEGHPHSQALTPGFFAGGQDTDFLPHPDHLSRPTQRYVPETSARQSCDSQGRHTVPRFNLGNMVPESQAR